MATVQQIVEEIQDMSFEELDLLLEIIQLRKGFKKTASLLKNMSHTHHMAHMPDSIINKDSVKEQN